MWGALNKGVISEQDVGALRHTGEIVREKPGNVTVLSVIFVLYKLGEGIFHVRQDVPLCQILRAGLQQPLRAHRAAAVRPGVSGSCITDNYLGCLIIICDCIQVIVTTASSTHRYWPNTATSISFPLLHSRIIDIMLVKLP